MRSIVLAGVACLFAWGCASGTDGHQHAAGAPYAGEQSRTVKALSAGEIAAYIDGAGMGFAKAAELNGYPGPLHSLENAAALKLSPAQVESMRSLLDSHKKDVRDLGAQVVALERDLDALFREHAATPAAIDAKTALIASAQARVRAAHLRAHLQATALLTPEQVARYQELRGYSGG
jgi:Spy/CpxP family protein refolding chaperone